MFPLNTPLEVIQLIYSWSAFSTNDVWVVQHFLNPLLFYMVFQNVWYSGEPSNDCCSFDVCS